ncbi:MAG: nucleotide exchange factor GrpE [Defluviitaleaceae bacterium]|nr:nucleotide exchange factor GrpE [Defluviitaleaceae bacterium]
MNSKPPKDEPNNEPEDIINEAEETADEIEVLEAPETDYAALYAQAQDRYQRNLAEFDNFRKRTTKEMAARYEDGVRAAAEKLLPIVDNFERAISTSENKEDNFYQGIALIARQFENVLSSLGIEPIGEGAGSVFDHNIHHAVAHIEDASLGQNVVSEVLQRGYTHRDKVIRPSMVKVAN